MAGLNPFDFSGDALAPGFVPGGSEMILVKIGNVPVGSALGYTLYLNGQAVGGRRTDGITPGDGGAAGGVYSVLVDTSFGADAVVWDSGGAAPLRVSIPLTGLTVAPPGLSVGGLSIYKQIGWVPHFTVTDIDTLDACTLTLVGGAGYGPTAGTSAPDAGGYHVMTWPGAAAVPAGTYTYIFSPTVNGAVIAPITGTVVLTASAPAPVNPFPAITLAGIKAKLVGLDSWLAAAARQEVPYDDQRILKNIPAVLRKFERETTVQIRPCQVITRDDGTYTVPVAGGKPVAANGLPIKKEEAYTYYPDNAFSYFITNLKTRPVQSVQRCRILFGTTEILEIPSEWYEVDTQSGSFQILPVQGSLLFAEYSSSFALLQQGFSNRNFIPHVVHFDYVAGLLPGWELDDEYADLLRVLEEYCALAVLNDISHLADAGLSGKSISGGGAGESYNYTRFMDRKKELKDSVQEFSDLWQGQEAPYMMNGL